jgi:hypothetical protein
MEELLRQDGYYIHQEVKEGGNGSGLGLSFRNENTYNYGIEKDNPAPY